MRKLCILVEGQTEVAFCKRVLSSYFGKRYMVIPITITTGKDKRGNIKKGGMVSWGKTCAELRRMAGTYKESDTVFSTMLDLYAISSDVPGYDAAQMKQDPYAKVDVIENTMKEKCAAMQGRIFVPYIQLHEFEALVLSDMDALYRRFPDNDLSALKAEVERIGNPELVDSGVETAPSKRLLQNIPSYDKRTDGISLIERSSIDYSSTSVIDYLSTKCKHFGEWMKRLLAI